MSKEIEKISNQLFELKEWLSEQPGHPSHLSNLPQWFWEDWGECIDDLKRLSKNKDEKDSKNKDGKDPNAIYDWGSFPLEKNFEWKNQNKEDGETDDPGQDIAIDMGR